MNIIQNQRVRLLRQTTIYLTLIAGSLIVFFPLVWTISTSLKTPEQVTVREVSSFPIRSPGKTTWTSSTSCRCGVS